MRVIANNVEYFDLMRDQGTLVNSPSQSLPESPSGEQSPITGLHADRALRDSLWYFDGESVRCWTDVEDLLKSASSENDRDLPSPVSIATDFYPTSVILNRGIVLGLDSELHRRRDVHFAMFRHTVRVCDMFSNRSELADWCRHNCSSLTFYVNVYPISTLPLLLSSHSVIRIYRTFRTRLSCSSTWFWTMRSMLTSMLKSRLCHQWSHSYLLSPNTLTSSYNVRARQKFDLGARFSPTCLRRSSSLKNRWRRIYSRQRVDIS